jgi:hypothetical protein
MRRVPIYSLVGLAVMATSEAGMLARVEPFYSWHTPIAWTGYILLVDGLVRRRRGTSWLSDSPAEFAWLAAASVPLWLVFEAFNLLIRNWHYINLPVVPWVRNFGYAWSFATIWPAIFETADLVASFRRPHAALGRPIGRGSPAAPMTAAAWLSVAAGAVMLAWPIVRPSPYLAAPVWLGFIFLLDPLNARAGGDSLLLDDASARWARVVNLGIGGLICGVVWECWNYWARTKWIYSVPILPDVKIFEMPILGYGGFPAFALECFTMYVTLRLLVFGPRKGRAIGI